MSYRKHLGKRCLARCNSFLSVLSEQLAQIKRFLRIEIIIKVHLCTIVFGVPANIPIGITLRGYILQIHRCGKQM